MKMGRYVKWNWAERPSFTEKKGFVIPTKSFVKIGII